MNVYSDYCTLHPSVKYVIHEFCTPKQNGAYSWCLVLCQRELVYATSDKQVCLVHLQDFIMYHKSSMCSWYMQHMCVCRLFFFCVSLCMQALGRTGARINSTGPAEVPFKFDFLGRSRRMLGTAYYCIIKMSKRVKLRFYIFRLMGSCHPSTIRQSLSARATYGVRIVLF